MCFFSSCGVEAGTRQQQQQQHSIELELKIEPSSILNRMQNEQKFNKVFLLKSLLCCYFFARRKESLLTNNVFGCSEVQLLDWFLGWLIFPSSSIRICESFGSLRTLYFPALTNNGFCADISRIKSFSSGRKSSSMESHIQYTFVLWFRGKKPPLNQIPITKLT